MAGPAVDNLAAAYAANNQPVVFIEYYDGDIGEGTFVDNRFMRAYNAHLVDPIFSPYNYFFSPTIMTESSASDHRYYEGDINWSTSDTQTYYKNNLVDPELARPPQAEVSSYMWPVGNKMHFVITVTNRSGVTLYAPANGAAVTGVVYEDLNPNLGLSSTSRLAVGEGTQAINEPLENGASATFDIETNDLGTTHPVHTVNWSNVHGVAFVDYQPAGASPTGLYDQLQAAMATYYPWPSWISVSSKSFTKWAIQGEAPFTQSQAIQLTGSPSSLTWTATKTAPWLSLSASSGTFPTTLTVTVNSTGLVPGLYPDTVHIIVPATLTNPAFSKDISVTLMVDLSPPKLFYLPLVRR